MSRQHTSADRVRSHRAGQRRIVHYCSCRRKFVGNAAWWSHCNAHPDHTFAGTTPPEPLEETHS